jgi:hypothetical protein
MMRLTRQAIVDAARGWVDVPFRPFGRSRQTGVDCIGLLICVGHDLQRAGYDLDLQQFGLDWDLDAYSMQPDPARILEELAKVGLRPIGTNDLACGDIAVLTQGFRCRAPGHFGLLADRGRPLSVIHAQAQSPGRQRQTRGRVVEQPLERWKSQVTHYYRIPGVT